MRRSIITAVVLLATTHFAHAQYSVADYLADVMDYSHTIAIARTSVEGADADLRRARKGYLPSLDMDREMNYTFRRAGDERRLGWSMRTDISQPIFDGGIVRADVKRAESRYDVVASREQASQLNVEYDAVAAYWELSRANIYQRAMADYRDIVRSLRDVVKRRFDEGYTAKGDLLQVESRLSDAEYLLSSADERRLVALHNFNVLRGSDPMAEVVLKESILDSMYMPPRVALDDILQRHPEYAASINEREYARWGVRATWAEFLPSINLGVYGLWQPNTPNVKGAGTRLDGGVVMTFHTPIFHFGERRQALRSARSNQRVAELEVEDMADRISLDESNGWTNLQSARARVDATRRNLALAKENLDISTYSYREGMATILDVLQAQLSWLQIYENAIAAHYDYALAIAAYRRIIADNLWW